MTAKSNAWDRPNGCYDLALIYENRKDMKNRIKALYLACETQPMNRRWWAELARAYAESGKREVAIGLMETALRIPKEKEDGYSLPAMHHVHPYDLLSQWCGELGLYKEGYEHCKEAFSLMPSDERIAKNVKQFRKMLARPQQPID